MTFKKQIKIKDQLSGCAQTRHTFSLLLLASQLRDDKQRFTSLPTVSHKFWTVAGSSVQAGVLD